MAENKQKKNGNTARKAIDRNCVSDNLNEGE